MDVKVDSEAMRSLVTKAIFDNLTQEQRDGLVSKAIEGLLTEPRSSGGYNSRPQPSPLQEAFNNAAGIIAHQIARERLQNDEALKAKIETLFADVAKRLFESEVREKLVDKISDAVVTGLGERYR